MQCTSTRTVPASGDQDAFEVRCHLDARHAELLAQHNTEDLGGYRYEWSEDDEDPWLARLGDQRDAAGNVVVWDLGDEDGA